MGYTVTTAGVTGVIKSIDLRKSRILAEAGKLHVVPNKAIETATWVVEARDEAGETEEEKKEWGALPSASTPGEVRRNGNPAIECSEAEGTAILPPPGLSSCYERRQWYWS